MRGPWYGDEGKVHKEIHGASFSGSPSFLSIACRHHNSLFTVHRLSSVPGLYSSAELIPSLIAHSSWLIDHGSWLIAHRPQLMALGLKFFIMFNKKPC